MPIDAGGAAPATAGGALPLDDTRGRILDAGIEVLRTVGHGQFSVQKVARVAGVYQGNITYYWPRRRDLVLALAGRVVEDYLRSFDQRFEHLDADGDAWAETVVCWLVEDAVSDDRVRLLPELWSMANADPEVAREVQRAYETTMDTVLRRLGLMPGTPAAAVVRRALELAGIAAQGLTAVHGHRDVADPHLVELRGALCALHVPALEEARERAAALADG
jgi:AcrR family transcriptional regulator